MRQEFGSILAIAMEQNDDVEPMLNEVLIAGFLIAAVAQVLGVFQDAQLG